MSGQTFDRVGLTASGGFELRGERSSLRRLVADLWASRDLVRMLSRQDFFVRYRRATLGMLWAIGLPLIQALVLAVVFTRVLPLHLGGSYPTFLFAGILPWTFFSAVITAGATSIVDGQALASKIYFPRPVLPLVCVGSALYGFGPSIPILIVFAVAMGVSPGPAILLLAPALVLMVLLTSAFALVLAPLHVYLRDVRYLVQAAVLVWFYATPVIYPLGRVPHMLREIIAINPATGMVELFRTSLLRPDQHWMTAVAWTAAWVAALMVAAAWLYRRYDRVAVDLL